MTDPLSAAARLLNGGHPPAAFVAALSYETLCDLVTRITLAQATERQRRDDEHRSTLADHPPTPGCLTCGATAMDYHARDCVDNMVTRGYRDAHGRTIVPAGVVMGEFVGFSSWGERL